MKIEIKGPATRITGDIIPPPDKSITHRAIVFSATAVGVTTVRNPLFCGDTDATLAALEHLGVSVRRDGPERLYLEASKPFPTSRSGMIIDCANSGTTFRLLLGLLAGRVDGIVLTGDSSLRARPMSSTAEPLIRMGASVKGTGSRFFPPVSIDNSSRRLNGIDCYISPPSAQVKSALILAALRAEGRTAITESVPTRDHTERLAAAMGADVAVDSGIIRVDPGSRLSGPEVDVPGDFSSAAPFLLLAALSPGSRLLVRNVGLNPTRTGFLRLMQRSGLDVNIVRLDESGIEPIGDIQVEGSSGVEPFSIGREEIPSMIDELILAGVMAAFSGGECKVQEASQLREKESDRITSSVRLLREFGVKAGEKEDGFTVFHGPAPRGGCRIESDDHRVLIAAAVLGLLVRGGVSLHGAEWVGVSNPAFFETVGALTGCII